MGKRIKQWTGITDEQIIELYWNRKENAITETDKKYGPYLMRIAQNILGDRLDCEECRNDTYIGVWNSIPPTRPGVFQAFIAQIMRRIAINRYKERSCQKRIPSELTVSMEELENALHSGQSVEEEYLAKEVGQLISGYVRGLDQRQRYIFIDRFYLAEPVKTIAAELSVSVPTVYREIEKLKQGLKLHLEQEGVYL